MRSSEEWSSIRRQCMETFHNSLVVSFPAPLLFGTGLFSLPITDVIIPDFFLSCSSQFSIAPIHLIPRLTLVTATSLLPFHALLPPPVSCRRLLPLHFLRRPMLSPMRLL